MWHSQWAERESLPVSPPVLSAVRSTAMATHCLLYCLVGSNTATDRWRVHLEMPIHAAAVHARETAAQSLGNRTRLLLVGCYITKFPMKAETRVRVMLNLHYRHGNCIITEINAARRRVPVRSPLFLTVIFDCIRMRSLIIDVLSYFLLFQCLKCQWFVKVRQVFWQDYLFSSPKWMISYMLFLRKRLKNPKANENKHEIPSCCCCCYKTPLQSKAQQSGVTSVINSTYKLLIASCHFSW